MIVTLFPCKMCQEVIKESKIKKVYYYLDNNKNINNKIEYIKKEDSNNYYMQELKDFFIDKR